MDQLILSPQALGNVIKRQRKIKNLSQEEAGINFNLDQTTISTVENGAAGTRLETIFRVLAALDLEMIIRPKKLESNHKIKEQW